MNSGAATMRAARYHAPNEPLRLEDVPLPSVVGDEVRVRVRAVGLCATELHFTDGFYAPARSPIALGHEVAGQVEELGSDVEGWRPGDRVVVNYYLFCGRCRACLAGDHNLCQTPRGWMAFRTDGGFAEFVTVPAHCLERIPDSMSFEAAAPLCCSATTALHACQRAALRTGETVVVMGSGGVGLSVVQAAKLAGARVLAVDTASERRSAATDVGADAAADPHSAREALDSLSPGGADVVFEFVGRTSSLGLSLALLGQRGRLVLVGYSEDKLTVAPFDLIAAEQTITTSAGNNQLELRLAVDLAARGLLRTVVADVRRLDQVNESLEDLRRGRVTGRIVLVP